MGVRKTKVPTREELFHADRMDLLALIKKLRDEIRELRLSLRAKNITIREERFRKRRHWETVKSLRQELRELK